MDISYQEVYTMNKEEARRLYYIYRHTSRRAVRKWVRRFEEEGDEGIKRDRKDQIPQQTSDDIERKVLQASMEGSDQRGI